MNKLQWRKSVLIAGLGAAITLVAAAQFFNIPAMIRTQVLNSSSSEGPELPFCDQLPAISSSSEGEDSRPCRQRSRAPSSPVTVASPIPPPWQPCADGQDNDQDGRTDTADPSCYENFDLNQRYIASNAEIIKPACSDQKDNDGDEQADKQDPGCYDMPSVKKEMKELAVTSREEFLDRVFSHTYQPWRNAEQGEPDCADGKDNDKDGATDEKDSGCDNPETRDYDPFENEPGDPGECDDKIDNDDDGFIDTADPGCHAGGHMSGTYDPNEDEIGGIACSDGADNETEMINGKKVAGGDGRIDIDDPGCHRGGVLKFPFIGLSSPYNPRDTNEGGEAACADGKDNDGDRLIDEADPGCHLGGRLNWAYLPRRNRE